MFVQKWIGWSCHWLQHAPKKTHRNRKRLKLNRSQCSVTDLRSFPKINVWVYFSLFTLLAHYLYRSSPPMSSTSSKFLIWTMALNHPTNQDHLLISLFSPWNAWQLELIGLVYYNVIRLAQPWFLKSTQQILTQVILEFQKSSSSCEFVGQMKCRLLWWPSDQPMTTITAFGYSVWKQSGVVQISCRASVKGEDVELGHISFNKANIQSMFR